MENEEVELEIADTAGEVWCCFQAILSCRIFSLCYANILEFWWIFTYDLLVKQLDYEFEISIPC